MLDMHKLKLKYRELSSQYAENLMQPVFKTSKRSYDYLQKGSPHGASLDKIINSADHSFENDNVSPQGQRTDNEQFNFQNSSRLKVEITGTDPTDIDKRRGASNLSNKNETFHSTAKMEHKFMPQYQKKQSPAMMNPGEKQSKFNNKNSGGLLSHNASVSSVSQANLMQNMESFGNLRTTATRNANGMTQDSPSHDQSQYMQVQSRHFNLSSPLNVQKGGSELNKMTSLNHNPKRKEVFFRSGKGQGLHKMTLDDSRSGDISDVTDFKSMGHTQQTYLQQIIEKPNQQNTTMSQFGKQTEDIDHQQLNTDLNKTQFGKKLRVVAAGQSISSTPGNHSQSQHRGVVKIPGPGSLGQSGLRHAVALEKLMDSNASLTESAIRDLKEMKEMVPRVGQNTSSAFNPSATSGSNWNNQQRAVGTYRQQAAQQANDEDSYQRLRHRRGKSVSVVNKDAASGGYTSSRYKAKGGNHQQENSAFAGLSSSVVQRKHSLQPLVKINNRAGVGGKSTSRGILSPLKDRPDIADRVLQRGRFGQLALQQQQSAAIHFQDNGATSPSRTYFPSHMSQTLNSRRRQSKVTLVKNQDAYDKEELLKGLMRRIKQKRTQLQDKNKQNQKAKDQLSFEMQSNAKLQNDVPASPEVTGDKTKLNMTLLNNSDNDQTMGLAQITAHHQQSLYLLGHQSHGSQQFTGSMNSPTDSFQQDLQQQSTFASPQLVYNNTFDSGQTLVQTTSKAASPFIQTDTGKDSHEQNRIHMLYKGQMNQDIEKERTLTQYQLKKTKFEKQKHNMNAQDLKVTNAELRQKIKRYINLIEEQKETIEKQNNEVGFQEDLNEHSVTRKLGQTDIGDISDTFELGSAVHKSLDNNLYDKRADLKEGDVSPVFNQGKLSPAIKQEDFNLMHSLVFERDVDTDHSLVQLNQEANKVNLSLSLAVKNTPASVHLRKAMEEIKHQANDPSKKISYKDLEAFDPQYNRNKTFKLLPAKNNNQQTDSSILDGAVRVQQDSLEALSRKAVQKLPMAANVDERRLGVLLEKFAHHILRQEKCVDVIVLFLDELQKACGYTKATMYALSPLMAQTVRKGATKDKQKYLNTIDYADKASGVREKLVGIAGAGMLCEKIVFESVQESIAPNLLRAQIEDSLAVSLQEHKIGIVVKNSDGVPTVLLQVELNSTRAQKKPLNMGDVNLLKLCILIMYERLQKFVIWAQAGTNRQSLSDIISFAMRTAKYECHKVLGRNLQRDLPLLEECAECNVLFEDRGSAQLYTIAYTEDDDYRNTNQNLINMLQDKIKKLSNNPRPNAPLIAAEQERVRRMREELELDMAMRSLILNRNHMVCMPSDQGLTGAAFNKAKTIYFNHFDTNPSTKFYPETDNIKAFKNISSFIFVPIIGHDLKPNGVIQLYNYKQPISRMQVKKMIALRKFIGGCLDGINLQSKNLESVVGAMTKVQGLVNQCEVRERSVESEQREILELQQAIKLTKKEITNWHTRATTEPGFMAPPVVEEEETPLEKFMKQKVIDDALEAEKQKKMDAMEEENKEQ